MNRAVLLLAFAGCHFHRDVNAPGIVDPLAPPKHLASPEREYPDDPGEHRLMLTTGVLGGGGGGTSTVGTSISRPRSRSATASRRSPTTTRRRRCSSRAAP
jgi:hypothetical protein